MPDKTIRVAVWEYRNAEGKRRRAYFGQTVDLTEDEITRGEAAGVFDQPEPGVAPFSLPSILPIDSDADTDDADAGGLTDEPADDEVIDDGADAEQAAADAPEQQPERPKQTAPVAEWREYAVSMGMDPDEAAKLSRGDLQKRFA